MLKRIYVKIPRLCLYFFSFIFFLREKESDIPKASPENVPKHHTKKAERAQNVPEVIFAKPKKLLSARNKITPIKKQRTKDVYNAKQKKKSSAEKKREKAKA